MPSEQALREMDTYTWLLSVGRRCGMSRFDRARLANYGRHVLAQYGRYAVVGRVANPGEFADRMLATDGAYSTGFR